MMISFIIPIYNGANYITRCLDSIYVVGMYQDGFEIIVVDDCSTDNTRELVLSYIEEHPQVRLLCQNENHRQGAARNRGLKEAKGDYVAFVDGDDIVLDGLLPAINWAERLKVDMVYCSCYHEKSFKDVIIKEINMPEGGVMSGLLDMAMSTDIDRTQHYDMAAGIMLSWMILGHIASHSSFECELLRTLGQQLSFFMPWFFYKSGRFHHSKPLSIVVKSGYANRGSMQAIL